MDENNYSDAQVELLTRQTKFQQSMIEFLFATLLRQSPDPQADLEDLKNQINHIIKDTINNGEPHHNFANQMFAKIQLYARDDYYRDMEVKTDIQSNQEQ